MRKILARICVTLVAFLEDSKHQAGSQSNYKNVIWDVQSLGRARQKVSTMSAVTLNPFLANNEPTLDWVTRDCQWPCGWIVWLVVGREQGRPVGALDDRQANSGVAN